MFHEHIYKKDVWLDLNDKICKICNFTSYPPSVRAQIHIERSYCYWISIFVCKFCNVTFSNVDKSLRHMFLNHIISNKTILSEINKNK